MSNFYFLLIAIIIAVVIFIVIRSVVLWYFKIEERVILQKKQVHLLEKLLEHYGYIEEANPRKSKRSFIDKIRDFERKI